MRVVNPKKPYSDWGFWEPWEGEIQKTRSKAIKTFCMYYAMVKNLRKLYGLSPDFDPADLSSLVEDLRKLYPECPLSPATRYDYAHAIRFCEKTIVAPTTHFTPYIMGKLVDKAFRLSAERVRQLFLILRKKECSLSDFLEEAIKRGMLEIASGSRT